MGIFANLFHCCLHNLQLAGAIAAVVLYLPSRNGVEKNHNWKFVLTTSFFSIIGCVIQVIVRRTGFVGRWGIFWSCWSGICSGILFVFWTAAVGIFAKAFIHLDAGGSRGIRLMQIAVYVDVGNMVTWFLTWFDMVVIFCILCERDTNNRREDMNPLVRNGRAISPSFVPHGWNDDDIEAQTRAVEAEHPSIRASIITQELHRSMSNSIQPKVSSPNATNEKSRIESVAEIPPSFPQELQSFWLTYSHLFGPTKECQICCEERPSFTGFPARMSKACSNHEQQACIDCVDKWIITELENNMGGLIHCSECRAVLEYEEVRALASPMTFARYEQMGIRGFVNNDPNFVWCQNCTSGQEHVGGVDQPIVTCQACGFRTCFKHQIPWHEEMLCDEYDERAQDVKNGLLTRKEEELASLTTIHKSTKPCANKACKAPIFKDEGCDHMRCWRCKQEFCWVCGGDWKKERHRAGCPFSK